MPAGNSEVLGNWSEETRAGLEGWVGWRGCWGLPLNHREPSVPFSQGLRSPGPPPCSFPGSRQCFLWSSLPSGSPHSRLGHMAENGPSGGPSWGHRSRVSPRKVSSAVYQEPGGLGVLLGSPGGLLRGGGQGLRPERREEPAGRDPGSCRTLQEGGHWP